MPIGEITVDELEERLAAGARVVDVREPDEYEEVHVPGAVLVPLATVADRVDEIRDVQGGFDDPLYVICKSGARSMRACEVLADHGLDVVNVAGGTMGWVLGGKPTSSGALPG